MYNIIINDKILYNIILYYTIHSRKNIVYSQSKQWWHFSRPTNYTWLPYNNYWIILKNRCWLKFKNATYSVPTYLLLFYKILTLVIYKLSFYNERGLRHRIILKNRERQRTKVSISSRSKRYTVTDSNSWHLTEQKNA